MAGLAKSAVVLLLFLSSFTSTRLVVAGHNRNLLHATRHVKQAALQVFRQMSPKIGDFRRVIEPL